MTHKSMAVPPAAGLIVLVLALAYVSLRLVLFQRALPPTQRGAAVSLFIVARHENADPARTPPGLIVLPGPGDYDGEYFYRLALHPLTPKRPPTG